MKQLLLATVFSLAVTGGVLGAPKITNAEENQRVMSVDDYVAMRANELDASNRNSTIVLVVILVAALVGIAIRRNKAKRELEDQIDEE